MYCLKCGTLNNSNYNYCHACGVSLKKDLLVNMSENKINNNYQFHQESSYQPTGIMAESPQIINNQQQYQSTPGGYYQKEKKSNTLGIISLILGIISFLTSLVFYISIPIGITGLILGIKNKVKNGVTIAGIILSAMGLTLAIVFVFIITNAINNTTYHGDGYSLEYDGNWSITTLSEEKEAFQCQNEDILLVHIGTSALPDSISDFNMPSNQKELYQAFYDYWNSESSANDNINILGGSNGFSKLSDDIYYATYTYGLSNTQIGGNYIILVSPEKNAVLSFMTNSIEDLEDIDSETLELLEKINIYKQPSSKQDINSDENVIYDNDLNNMLNSLSDWNRYSGLRTGNLGKIKSINGVWRILSDSEICWKFENGQFWWYKSVNDLNDNYWYGTTQILTGKAGFTAAGLDESLFDTLTSYSSGKVTENDVYTVFCTPTKIISGDMDKSDTNIPAGTTWTYVWILIDRGTEGIEAQVLNTENYNTSSYVKIAD